MNKLEELAEKILEYEANTEWYEICDQYGNIDCETEARNQLFDEILTTLKNSPNDILERLKLDIEEFKLDKSNDNKKDYETAKELVKQIEELEETEEIEI